MSELHKVVVHDGRVTMTFVERGYRGQITRRHQVTVDQAGFERQMLDAKVEVPWRNLI